MEESFNYIINEMRTVLNDRFNGIATPEFLELANETKEKFKDNFQSFNKLTVQDALVVDRMFDEFIENL